MKSVVFLGSNPREGTKIRRSGVAKLPQATALGTVSILGWNPRGGTIFYALITKLVFETIICSGVENVGSNPTEGTNTIYTIVYGDVAQLGEQLLC